VRLPFLNWYRYELLGGVSSWISGNEGFIQAKGGPYLLSFRRDGKAQTFLFVINLAHDDINRISFEIGFHKSSRIKRLDVLGDSGIYETVKFKTYYSEENFCRIVANIPLKGIDFKIFKIKI
ncbi:MAG: hypothetical protein HY578_00950, partial [Nitrospinae bacterium]|nr:hypothetical protein [Nitrospinota bacterium]